MDPELIQRTRYILHMRFRRAKTCPTAILGSVCTQLLNWLNKHPVTAAHISGLKQPSSTGTSADVYKIENYFLERKGSGDFENFFFFSNNQVFYNAVDTEQHAAICFAILEVVARSFNELGHSGESSFLSALGVYLTKNTDIELDEAIREIRDRWVI
jgi:hypothetical protein